MANFTLKPLKVKLSQSDLMLSAVIIVLREFLEAALITSVLLSISRVYRLDMRWFFYAVCFGISGALVYAYHFDSVSDWFDGVGQEVVNAMVQLLVVALVTIYSVLLVILTGSEGDRLDNVRLRYVQSALRTISIIVVALSLLREIAEIIIYGSGFSASLEMFQPVLIGGALGMGIAISLGALIYNTLVNLPKKLITDISQTLLVLIAAGMVSQAVLFLIQADWLPSQLPLWDSSSILSEQSLLGQLFYALIGYEATPTALQVSFYGVTLFLIATAIVITKLKQSRNFHN